LFVPDLEVQGNSSSIMPMVFSGPPSSLFNKAAIADPPMMIGKKTIVRYTLYKIALGRQNIEQEGERYDKSEDVKKDGYQKGNNEDCF
jgi:hypothetical protein